MHRDHFLARLLRALSGKSQETTAAEIGVHRSLVGHIEQGQVHPRLAYLIRLAATGSLTVEDASEVLSFAEERHRARQGKSRRKLGLSRLDEELATHVARVACRLQALPAFDCRSATAGEALHRRVCLALCDESERAASRQLEEAAVLAEVARAFAERAPGP